MAGVLDDAVVATDDERIYDAVVAFGGKAEIIEPESIRSEYLAMLDKVRAGAGEA